MKSKIHHKQCFILNIFMFVATVCMGQEDAKYSNPVISRNVPDPTVIKASDGYFYLYATGRVTPIYKSKNLVNWDFAGTAFTEETRPSFEPNGGIWAPDINVIDGKYVLYYSMSVWGGEQTCGIGVAVADSPDGTFTDRGKLFRSNEIEVQNSIDQFYLKKGRKQYLFWGSFHGIFCIELAKNGLEIKKGAKKRQIAGSAFEGTYIHKKGKYYYLFASTGTCCEGVKSTYRLVVGRSKSLFGPYLDKSGNNMMDNGYSPVIASNECFTGNGHCSEIVQDEAGDDWILYHGVDITNPRGRVLLLDQIKWDDKKWPFIESGTPSLTASIPVFY
jgi:arabinan endo-1,5-alpha-L-arabinosidase